jgi:hypothetical protein
VDPDVARNAGFTIHPFVLSGIVEVLNNGKSLTTFQDLISEASDRSDLEWLHYSQICDTRQAELLWKLGGTINELYRFRPAIAPNEIPEARAAAGGRPLSASEGITAFLRKQKIQ